MSLLSEEHCREHSPLLIDNMESNLNKEIVFNIERQTSELSYGSMKDSNKPEHWLEQDGFQTLEFKLSHPRQVTTITYSSESIQQNGLTNFDN